MRTRRPARGLLVVLSAPSGGGKTTIVSRLLARNPGLARSISTTTRKPRRGEREGRDYYFLTEREFLEKRRKRDFLEWASVFGHYYGTLRKKILEKLREGRDVVLAIDVQGARQVRRKMKGLFLFIMPPSMEDLEKRLLERQRDPRKEIEKRLQRARLEMACAREYDYVVTNRYLGETVRAIEEILAKETGKRNKAVRRVLATQRVVP